MRMQHRNKQKFKYALFLRAEKVYDDNGLFTGDYKPVYSKPRTGYANINSGYISANHMSGTAAPSPYGLDLDYVKTISAPTDFGMDERSILWVDDLKSENHDYIVRRIGRSLNSVRIAINRVDTTGGENIEIRN